MVDLQDAVIVDAVRTPIGARHGQLSGWHPVELAAEILRALATRNGIEPGLIEDVIMGCVSQVGAQGANVGRNAVLAAGWPESVPATTVDRQDGSSQQAAHFAAQGIMAGAYDIVIAAGVEVMSVVPMGASLMVKDAGQPFPESMQARYASDGGLQPQGIAAEGIADRWNLSRAQLDGYAVSSHRRAAHARDEGRFEREILPVAEKILDRDVGRIVETGTMVVSDDGIRDCDVESLGALKPAFRPDGKITAANSSQISDGAAGLLIMSESRAADLGLRPRARFHTFALAGVDPISMLTGSIPATDAALERAGLSVEDIDVFEVNETFASVVLAWAE